MSRAPVAAGYKPSVAPLGTSSGQRTANGMRLGTAQRDPNLASVGLSTNVVVDNRPVTRQGGLTGMHTQSLGPGRQIADDRFFLTLLRTRIQEISTEMQNMRDECDKIREGNQLYQTYERKYETTIKEVRLLEGELADFNLALDKMRTHTDVEDIKMISERCRQNNEAERMKVDRIFKESLQKQKLTKQVEEQIEEIHAEVAQRMASVSPAAKDEYSDIQMQLNVLNAEIGEKEQAIQELDQKGGQLQSTLDSPQYQMHQHGLELQKERRELASRKLALEDDTDSSLSPEELKEKLLKKVKDANKDIELMEKRISMMDTVVERYQDEIREKESELVQAKNHAQKAKKYEAVYERDRKMQEFIDTFPQANKDENARKKELKNVVVALMKHISKGLQASESAPDAEQLSDMKKELSFKEQKLSNSKDTLNVLQADLSKRKAELEKINTLDKKISMELKSLKGKILQMNTDMNNFKGEDELKEEAKNAKNDLRKEMQHTKKVRDSIKQQVQLMGHAYEKKKRELDGNETMKRVDGLEQKLRTYSQTVFTLTEYIQSRKRESDYNGISKQVMETTGKINKHIIEMINAK